MSLLLSTVSMRGYLISIAYCLFFHLHLLTEGFLLLRLIFEHDNSKDLSFASNKDLD